MINGESLDKRCIYLEAAVAADEPATLARFASSFPRILLTLRLNLVKPLGLLSGGLVPPSRDDIAAYQGYAGRELSKQSYATGLDSKSRGDKSSSRGVTPNNRAA